MEALSWKTRSGASRTGVLVLVIVGLLVAGWGSWRVWSSLRLRHFRHSLSELNVIVITMDTTRYDHIGCFGSLYTRTPNIDRLGKGGVRFMQTIAVAPITLPSHTAILTGTFPIWNGVRNNGTFKVPERNVTLAEALKAQGYQTGAVIGAFVLNSKFGLNQGFDYYNDELANPNAKLEFFFDEIPAAEVSRLGREYIEQHQTGKFFLWLHFFDPHAAYRPPSPYKDLYGPANLYDGEIAYVDENIGKLIDFLEEKKLLDRTLIVLTADHGESLGDHGEPSHGLLAYDTTLHVPLLFYLQDKLPAGTMVKEMVRSVDIMPTVLDILGYEPTPESQGMSLLPRMFGSRKGLRGLQAFIENYLPYFNFGYAAVEGVRTDDYKFLNAPEPELYDEDKDPREYKNLYFAKDGGPSRRGGQYEEMYHELREEVAHGEADKFQQEQLSEEDKDKLRALGYVMQGDGKAPTGGEEKQRKDPKMMIGFMTALNRVGDMIRKEQWDRAEEFIKLLLEKDPDNLMAMQKLLSVYRKTNNLSGSIEITKKMLALNPDYLQMHLQLARFYIQKATYLPEKDPEQKKAKDDMFAQAIAEINFVLAKDNRYAQAKSDLGACYFNMGNFALAEETLRRGMEENPSYPYLVFNLGSVLAEQGKELAEKGKAKDAATKYDEAEKLFLRAITLNRADPDFYYSLAKLYQLRGDRQKAREFKDRGAQALQRLREAEKEAVEIQMDNPEAVTAPPAKATPQPDKK